MPVFLPGESQGQRNLVGCSPRGLKESGMTERRSRRCSCGVSMYEKHLKPLESVSREVSLRDESLDIPMMRLGRCGVTRKTDLIKH